MYSSSNPLLVNYHDACMYQSDLDIVLSSKAWLNDAVIHFRMIKLAQRHNKVNGLATFLDPSIVTFFARYLDLDDDGDNIMADLRKTWKFHPISNPDNNITTELSKQWFCGIVPVNDSHADPPGSMAKIGGGTHWSLLLVIIPPYTTTTNTTAMTVTSTTAPSFLHFDSSPLMSNSTAARIVADKMHRILLDDRRCSVSCEGSSGGCNENIHVIECHTPNQVNGYDCGIHTLLAADAAGAVAVEMTMMMTLKDLAFGGYFVDVMREKVEAYLHHMVNDHRGPSRMARELRTEIVSDVRSLITD